MEKNITKRIITGFFIVAILLFSAVSFFSYEKINHIVAHTPVSSLKQSQTNYFSYFGKNGYNALTLLEEKTSIEKDHAGLIVSINNRKAIAGKHEYWAFYVNGKMASVGPFEYQTKDTDKMEWKIEKY